MTHTPDETPPQVSNSQSDEEPERRRRSPGAIAGAAGFAVVLLGLPVLIVILAMRSISETIDDTASRQATSATCEDHGSETAVVGNDPEAVAEAVA
jgi:Na+-transporting methylmalonyl-CoA/oxaloacetate decarboxylase gamma subunit